MSVAARMLETYPKDLGGVDRGKLVACIEACLECAQACTACRACADECGRHAEHHDHCRICADVCRQCERMCDELLSALG